MIKIGITGGSGCGKTTALRWLASKGAYIIDCDDVYHDLLATNTDMILEIKTRFPKAFTDDKLDRKKLGGIVFNDEACLKDLNFITHKYVDDEVNKLIEAHSDTDIIAIDAIALLESGLSQNCDCVVGVIAPTELRVQRLMRREGISESYAKARINAQQSNGYYIRQCQYILENNGDYEDFYTKCKEVLGKILTSMEVKV